MLDARAHFVRLFFPRTLLVFLMHARTWCARCVCTHFVRLMCIFLCLECTGTCHICTGYACTQLRALGVLTHFVRLMYKCAYPLGAHNHIPVAWCVRAYTSSTYMHAYTLTARHARAHLARLMCRHPLRTLDVHAHALGA